MPLRKRLLFQFRQALVPVWSSTSCHSSVPTCHAPRRPAVVADAQTFSPFLFHQALVQADLHGGADWAGDEAVPKRRNEERNKKHCLEVETVYHSKHEATSQNASFSVTTCRKHDAPIRPNRGREHVGVPSTITYHHGNIRRSVTKNGPHFW